MRFDPSSASSANVGGAQIRMPCLAITHQVRERRQVSHHVRIVEEHGLPAEGRLVLNPVEHVGLVEGLREDIAWTDAGGLELVDHLLRVHLLREPVEGHRDGRRLELRCHLDAKLFEERDAFLERQEMSAGRARVQVGAEVWRATEVFRWRLRGGVERVHLAGQRLELGERELARAALGAGRCDRPARSLRAWPA